MAPNGIAIGLLAIGILLRLWEYCFDRALWLDEAMIALSITRRNFAQLLEPLKFNQAAPIGFLWIEKLATLALGDGERALRLAPLIFGIIAIALIAFAARFLSISSVSFLVALALAIVSKPLLRYSNEIKQYSLDSAAAAAILLLSLALLQSHRSLPKPLVIGWAAMLAISPWFSHPAIFAGGGAAAALLVHALHNHHPRLCMVAILSGAGAACSFAVNYFLFDRHAAGNAYLQTFWSAQMMPTHSFSAAIAWAIGAWRDAADVPFGRTGRWLTLVGMLAGLAALWRRRQFDLLLLLLLPLVLAFVAAMLGKYPFADRLLCFAIPMMILLISIAFDAAWRLHTAWRALAPIFLTALLAEPTANAIADFLHPRTQEEITQAMAYVQSHRRAGDRIVVLNEARMAFAYYASRFGLDRPEPWIAISEEGDSAAVAGDIHRLAPLGKIWIIFSAPGKERIPKEQSVLAALNDVGRPLDAFHAPGAAAYRYRLFPAAAPAVSSSPNATSPTITFVPPGADPPP